MEQYNLFTKIQINISWYSPHGKRSKTYLIDIKKYLIDRIKYLLDRIKYLI